MFNKKTVKDIDVACKKVLVRVDYNVPLDENFQVTDNTRIKLSLDTVNYLIEKKSKVILMAHLGRPKGEPDDKFRLDPAARELEKMIGVKVKKFDETVSEQIKDYIDNTMDFGEVVMLENVRFNPGEKSNDPQFAQSLASLAEIFVDDAFGAAHRAHASVAGVAEYLPAVAGFLLQKEVETLDSLLENPQRPFIALLGGSKVSDKIQVIKNFLGKVDTLILGGGMSYTFFKAKGYEIGTSICEDDQLDYAREMLELAKKNNVKFLLPMDIVVSKEYDKDSDKQTVSVQSIPVDWMGMDLGEKSIELYRQEIAKAATIFWNGPFGVFEWERFENGTRNIAEAVAQSNAVTVVGGGDTLAAIKKYNLSGQFTHVSSGGGAAMELLEGKVLPGVAALMDK